MATHIARVAAELAAERDPQRLIDRILARAREVFGAAFAGLDLWEPEAGAYRVTAAHDDPGFGQLRYIAPGEGLNGLVVARGEVVIVADYLQSGHALPQLLCADVGPSMGAPIRLGEEIVGSLIVQARRGAQPYTAVDGELLASLADLTSVALANARTLRALELEVAERRRAQAERQAGEARQRLLVETIQEQTSLYQTLLQAQSDLGEGVLIHTGVRLRYVNEALCRITGYSRAELLALSAWWQIVAPEERERVQRYGQARLRSASAPPHYETLLLTRDDRRIPVEVAAKAVTISGQVEVLAIVRDITARRQAEAALRDTTARLVQVLDVLPEGLLILDADGRIVMYNATAMEGRRTAGIPLVERFPLAGSRRADGSPYPPDEAPIARVLRRGEVVRGEQLLIPVEDGRLAPVLVNAAPLRDAAGATVGAVVAFQDISRLRQAEASVRAAETFLDSIVEHLPTMLFVKRADNLRFVRLNRAGEELLGIAREELLGKTDCELFPPEQAAAFQARDRRTLAECALVDIPEEVIQSRHLGPRLLHTRMVPILDEHGQPRFLLGVSEDITERRRLEEQLVQAQKLEAVGRLAGGVAHDFNNLLNLVIGFGELLADDHRLDLALQPFVRQIIAAGERGAALTEQLLAVGRRQLAAPTVLDLNAVVTGATQLVRRLLGEDVALRVQLSPTPCWVKMSHSHLEQILFNLALNARDAMPDGGTLTIRTELGHMIRPGGVRPGTLPAPGGAGEATDAGTGPAIEAALLIVSDTGVGMDETTRGRIFEPFFTTKQPGRGTGLGLASVYAIVQQSGGQITVDSAVGAGTTFRIALPLVPTEAAVDPPQPMATPVPPETRSGTILLVEDEPRLRLFARHALESAGYRVLDAANARDALALEELHDGTIDLLLTDVVMPGLSGRALAEQLCARRPGLRVLYVSGYADDAVLRRGIERSSVNFLPKPFRLAELLAAVARALEGPVDDAVRS